MKASSIGKKTLRVITRQKAVVAIIVMMVMMLFFDTKFYTSYSILEMLRSAAILEIWLLASRSRLSAAAVTCPSAGRCVWAVSWQLWS